VDVYFTDLAKAWKPLPPVPGLDALIPGGADLPQDLTPDHVGLTDDVPFLLDQEGRYDLNLNRFFRELRYFGAPAPNTWKAYARDISHFAKFLRNRQGKTLWEAELVDVTAFRTARRVGETDGLAPSSWNRALRALDRFYRWALEESLIDRLPFRYRKFTVNLGGGASFEAERNLALDPDDEGPVEYVGLDDFVYWRDVGMRGFRSEFEENPNFRSTTVARNVAAGEILVTTGLRASEFLGLLDCEWGLKAGRVQVPGILRKNRQTLTTHLSARQARRLRLYFETERKTAIQRGRSLDPPFGIEEPIYILRRPVVRDRIFFHTSRSWTTLGKLSAADRRRLIWVSEEGEPLGPAVGFLTDDGRPLPYSGLYTAFQEANKRCAARGRAMHLTPHMLRHTFAVNMLEKLIRIFVAEAARDQLKSAPRRAYLAAIGDPLRRLQKLLGHKQITSTYIYLDHLDEAQDIIDRAVEAFTEDLEGAAIDG
jgi:site-specific recombinase XerD